MRSARHCATAAGKPFSTFFVSRVKTAPLVVVLVVLSMNHCTTLPLVLGQQVGQVVPNLRKCSDNLICPTGSTCCPPNGCAPGVHANCCPTVSGVASSTACPRGYVCTSNGGCELEHGQHNDNLPNTAKQMALCAADPSTLSQAYGLPIHYDGTSTAGLFPYFSSAGNLLSPHNAIMPQIKAVVIMSHGYRFNYDADTHLCSIMAACSKARGYEESDRPDCKSSMLFVAPWFLRPHDVISNKVQSWNDDTNGQENVLRWGWDDSWRYGGGAKVSSFTCLDTLVDTFLNRTKFPHLANVTIVGDSYGADLVLRWALLTSSHWPNKDDEQQQQQQPYLNVVGINPFSYTFLNTHRRPQEDVILEEAREHSCPSFDLYPHGLSSHCAPGTEFVSYRDRALALLEGNVTAMAVRYSARDVTYAIGEFDVEPIAWRQDLEDSTRCAEAYQGFTRKDRMERYLESLEQVLGGAIPHRMVVGEGTAHDGPRMLQTDSVLEAVFGNFNERFDDGTDPPEL